MGRVQYDYVIAAGNEDEVAFAIHGYPAGAMTRLPGGNNGTLANGDRHGLALEGDAEVRKNAYQSLYKLGALSLDELFEMARKKPDSEVDTTPLIEGIAWESIYPQTRFAMSVFDRIIAELPGREYPVASAHFWKTKCFEILKEYDDALRECEEVMKFPQFDNLTAQISDRQTRLNMLKKAEAVRGR